MTVKPFVFKPLASAKPATESANEIKPIESNEVPSEEIKPIDSASNITGLDLLDSVPTPMTYKEQLAEIPSLDELANEFNNPEQPEAFDDAALAAVHKACLQIESAIDNAEEVRTQLTFIMTELKKYPETAAKVYDCDMATMVRALRQNYNVVAFAKQANKKAKAEKASKVAETLSGLESAGLFDGLDF